MLLLQAARKSGTVMYASYAKDQNRDVFVWPGPQGDPAFAGGWDLLEDGAKAVERGEEILEEFQYRSAGRGKIISLPAPRAWQAEEAAIPVLADPGLPALSQAQAAVLAALTDTPQAVAQLEEGRRPARRAASGRPDGIGAAGPGPVPPGEAVQPADFPRRRVFPSGRKGPCPAAGEASPLAKGQENVLAALTDTPRTLVQLEEATGLPAGQLLGAPDGIGAAGPGPVPPGESAIAAAPPLWLEGRRPLPGAAGPPQGAGLST